MGETSLNVPLHIPIRRLFIILSSCVLVLLMLHGALLGLKHFAGIQAPEWLFSRLDPDLEQNIPNWFSTITLACVSALALLIHGLRTPPAGRLIERWFWLMFGFMYAFLSLDEAARLHELIDQLGPENTKWVYFYSPLAAVIFLVCVYHLGWERRDDPALRNWIIGGLVVTASGALLAEYINHVVPLTALEIRIEMTVEEFLEMLGTVMVLMGCLREFERRFNRRFHAEPRSLSARPGRQK
jgi:hypothetical protein